MMTTIEMIASRRGALAAIGDSLKLLETAAQRLTVCGDVQRAAKVAHACIVLTMVAVEVANDIAQEQKEPS